MMDILNSNFIVRGLENPNNLCYLNSAFQILLSSPSFREFVYAYYDQNTILNYFYQYLSNKGERTQTLLPFKKYLSRYWPEYGFDNQMDCQEVLLRIVQKLEEQFPDRVKDLFDLETETTIVCQDCAYVSFKRESSRSIDILPQQSMSGLFSKTTERLPDLTCDQCKAVGSSIREYGYLRPLPENVIIQIHRYNYSNSSIDRMMNSFKYRDHMYYIRGAVIHTGGSSGGHYKTLFYDVMKNTWMIANDCSVNQVDSDIATNMIKRNACLLLYA
jgi:uncharacterized UBP type Zn finger protein